MRVVLDTNIIVSALLNPIGPPAQIFVLVMSGSIRMCVTGSIFAEYEEVLRRPKLSREPDIVTATLSAIRERSLWVKPTESVHACSDKDDDIFLECAEAAQAGYVVTGNIKHFPSLWRNTRILSARHFLDLLPGADPLN
jgi:putative PIN family toxin of toxin-antitoxin system